MNIANVNELNYFIDKYPSVSMMEVLMVDINGIIRCKRIPRSEFEELFTHGIKGPASTVLLNVKGEFCDELNKADLEGDPDRLIKPIKNTLSYIPWLDSETAQVMATFTELNGDPNPSDPRNVLISALDALRSLKSMPEDLWDQDKFLDDVRSACECQNVPMTTIHSEYSPGQFEINLHHTSDPVKACQDAFLLKRLIKGIARKHNMSATFMAKPFMNVAGNGLHIHLSLYDKNDQNIFSDVTTSSIPAVSNQLIHAIGGLSELMGESMAVFAPNANSYRRLIPGNFAPLTPNWGYNHRDVALRIPVSDSNNMRIEHRVAGADANPYLVLSVIIAGVHHGITQQINPSEMILEGAEIEEKITLSRFWPDALNEFSTSAILPQYLGADFCKLFETVRRGEMEEINSQITNIDYEWYLRAM